MAKRVHNQGPSEHFYRMARADLERFWGRMTSEDKKYWYEYNTKGVFFRDFGRTNRLDPAAVSYIFF